MDLDPEQVSNDLEVSPFPIGVEAPFRLEEGNELLPIPKYLHSARNFPFKGIKYFIHGNNNPFVWDAGIR